MFSDKNSLLYYYIIISYKPRFVNSYFNKIEKNKIFLKKSQKTLAKCEIVWYNTCSYGVGLREPTLNC